MLRGARWGGGISHPSCCVRSFILEWKQCLMLSDKSLLSRMPPCLEFNTESQISLSCFAQLRTLLEAFSVHLRPPVIFFNFRLLTEQLIKIEQINPLLSMRIAWGPWESHGMTYRHEPLCRCKRYLMCMQLTPPCRFVFLLYLCSSQPHTIKSLRCLRKFKHRAGPYYF